MEDRGPKNLQAGPAAVLFQDPGGGFGGIGFRLFGLLGHFRFGWRLGARRRNFHVERVTGACD